MGRFTIAAKHHISIAEIYESELVDIEKAIAHYEQAADYYKGEESNRTSQAASIFPRTSCLLWFMEGSYLELTWNSIVEFTEQTPTTITMSPLHF
ncbi:hypothetical protein GOODEAATRI_020819 [Goodea atripinnis]|uniref:Uncharacterized protein n=1 Tax=Goodea atripinnis TaxID=208336 RepID=A0ABV0MJG8_9TELE